MTARADSYKYKSLPMTNDTSDTSLNQWSDDEMKAKLEGSISKAEPEESGSDPFALDALGHQPAEEDDSGSAE